MWMYLLYKSYDMHWQVNAVGPMLITVEICVQVLAGPVIGVHINLLCSTSSILVLLYSN